MARDEGGQLDRELVLDGNAVAGLLWDVYGTEMTAASAECAHCGSVAQFGAMRAYIHGPGVTLRCPSCEGVMVRIVAAPQATYVDSRGSAHVRIARHSSSQE